MAASIRIKRVYDPPAKADGFRVLVDRLWPRGVSKSKARIDLWMKEIAPSRELREWYGHDPGKWREFKGRYFRELDGKPAEVEELMGHLRSGAATLLYASRERDRNNAEALKEYLGRSDGRPRAAI